MKKTIQLSLLIALVVLGIGMVNTSLSALSGTCLCFNDTAAWSNCESLCQGMGNGYCVDVRESNSMCIGGDCDFYYWSECQDGTKYRRVVKSYGCPDCAL